MVEIMTDKREITGGTLDLVHRFRTSPPAPMGERQAESTDEQQDSQPWSRIVLEDGQVFEMHGELTAIHGKIYGRISEPAPAAVALPNRDPSEIPDDHNIIEESYAAGCNARLEKVKELNQ
jgi:hypothetical protein